MSPLGLLYGFSSSDAPLNVGHMRTTLRPHRGPGELGLHGRITE